MEDHLRRGGAARRIGAGLLAMALSIAAASPVLGQDRPAERTLPTDLRPPCEEAGVRPGELLSSVPDEDRAEAERLAEQASRAAILGDLPWARRLLEQAARLDPGSEEIAYRLGRILEEEAGAAGEAIVFFCRYVALDPNGTEVDEVRRRILELSAAPDERRPAASPTGRSPAAALVTGLVLPGSGHIYTDRPGRGLLVFLAAGGSVVAGAMYSRTEVECLVEPVSNECPEEMISGIETSRPFLAHGVAMAGAITILSAVHAAVTVRRGNEAALRGLAVTVPLPGPGGDPPVVTLDALGGSGGGLRATVRLTVP